MLNTIFTSADCVAAELPQLPTDSDHGHSQLIYPVSIPLSFVLLEPTMIHLRVFIQHNHYR